MLGKESGSETGDVKRPRGFILSIGRSRWASSRARISTLRTRSDYGGGLSKRVSRRDAETRRIASRSLTANRR